MPHSDEATDHSSELNFLPERYLDAAGCEPPESAEQLRKQRDKYLKAHPGLICNESLFEDRRAERDDDLENEKQKTPTNPELFGTLWRRGELTVLCGPTGAGKTILAVQLAESIARGRRIEPFRAPASEEVLYLDLERTRAQHDERYSVAGANGRRRRREYKFSDRFHHIGMKGGGLAIPETFNGDLARYWQHSIQLALASPEARIIMIDSLASLDARRGRSAQARQLRALKLHASTHNLSMLVVTSTGSPPYEGGVDAPRRNARGRRGGSLFPRSEIADIADSIFALAPSTMAEDIRYIKQLKSNSAQPLLPPNQVLTYRLSRNSPPCLGGVPEGRGGSPEEFPVSTDSRLQTQDSRITTAASPFLGFEFLGFSSEEQHLLDYTAAAHARLTSEATRLKRLRSGSVVEMLMSPEYGRYLKGE